MAFKMNKPSVIQGTAGHKSAVKKAASALKHALDSRSNPPRYHTDYKYVNTTPADGPKRRSKSSHAHKGKHDGAIIGTQRTVQSIKDEEKKNKTNELNRKDKVNVQNKSGTTDSGVKKTGSALKNHTPEHTARQVEAGKPKGYRSDSTTAKKEARQEKRASKREAKAKEAIDANTDAFTAASKPGASKAEKRASSKTSRKATRTNKRAVASRAVANAQLRKKGGVDRPQKPGKTTIKTLRAKPGLISGRRSKVNITATLQARRDNRKDQKERKKEYRADKKEYNQGKGLRGQLNAARTTKTNEYTGKRKKAI